MRNRRSFILITAAIVVLAVPAVVGWVAVPGLRAQAPAAESPTAPANRPSFDVASVKRDQTVPSVLITTPPAGGRYTANYASLRTIITAAYQLKSHQLISASESDRLLSKRFDIEAKAEGNPSRGQMWLMLQSLLADRFKLVVHHETRQLPVYALVLSKAGKPWPQFKPHSGGAECTDAAGSVPAPHLGPGEALPPFCGDFTNIGISGGIRSTGSKVTIDMLIAMLGNFVDRAIVDQTGLSGTFDLTLQFAPQQTLSGSQLEASVSVADPSAPASIFTAIQEQLGLKLESTRGPLDVLVIDHVEEPSPN